MVTTATLTIGDDVYCFRNLWYGTCSTAASTAIKSVSSANFSLFTGVAISVTFSATNTADVTEVKLDVNSTGAKAIKYHGSNLPDAGVLAANRTYMFIYDGTNYILVGDLDTASGAVAANQGTNNAGKFLVVNSQGIVEAVTMSSWQGGDY